MNKKQVFKGENLTRTKVYNQIMKVWNKCSEEDKFDWYKDAQDFAKSVDSLDYKKVCGVISALSPLKTWRENKKLAKQVWDGKRSGHIGIFIQKAEDIINLENPSDDDIVEVLRGKKISSFYLNICYPDRYTSVTIDRHALSIALGRNIEDKDMQGITTNQYNFFRDCYIWTADRIGINPLLLQSSTWVKWRKLKSEPSENVVPKEENLPF